MITHKIEKFNIEFNTVDTKVRNRLEENIINSTVPTDLRVLPKGEVRQEEDHFTWEYNPSFSELPQELREEYLTLENSYGRD